VKVAAGGKAWENWLPMVVVVRRKLFSSLSLSLYCRGDVLDICECC
jgi:hypothetical protein